MKLKVGDLIYIKEPISRQERECFECWLISGHYYVVPHERNKEFNEKYFVMFNKRIWKLPAHYGTELNLGQVEEFIRSGQLTVLC